MGEVGREIIESPSREDIWDEAVKAMGETQARRWMKTSHPKLNGKSPNVFIEEDPTWVCELVLQMLMADIDPKRTSQKQELVFTQALADNRFSLGNLPSARKRTICSRKAFTILSARFRDVPGLHNPLNCRTNRSVSYSSSSVQGDS